MALLTGMTETGLEVPVQVKPDGKLVAEGLQGPAGRDGIDAVNLWDRTGTELSPKTAGDSVFTSGAVKVGGTTAAPSITLRADGSYSGKKAISVRAASASEPVISLGNSTVGGVFEVYGDGKLISGVGDLNSAYSHRVIIEPAGNILLGGTLPASPNITLKADGTIRLRSPNGAFWDLRVSDAGTLTVTAA